MFATALRFYDVVVFIHIAAVVTAFGVTFVYPLIVPLTQRSAPDKLPWLHQLQGEVGRKIITPSAAVVLLAGLYLGLSGDGPFDLKDWWVGFGLLAILVLLGLGGAVFAPREPRAAAPGAGPPAPPRRAPEGQAPAGAGARARGAAGAPSCP